MESKTALSILFGFTLFFVGFGLVYGAVFSSTIAVGISMLGGGTVLFIIVLALIQLEIDRGKR